MNPNRQFAKSIREFMEERQSLDRGQTVVNEGKKVDEIKDVIDLVKSLETTYDTRTREAKDFARVKKVALQALESLLGDAKLGDIKEEVVNEESLNEFYGWRDMKNPLTRQFGLDLDNEGMQSGLIRMKKRIMQMETGEERLSKKEIQGVEDIFDEIMRYAVKEFNQSLKKVDKFIESRYSTQQVRDYENR